MSWEPVAPRVGEGRARAAPCVSQPHAQCPASCALQETLAEQRFPSPGGDSGPRKSGGPRVTFPALLQRAFWSRKTDGLYASGLSRSVGRMCMCVQAARYRCVCACVYTQTYVTVEAGSRRWGRGTEMKSTEPLTPLTLICLLFLCGMVSSPVSPGDSDTRLSSISGKVTTYIFSSHFSNLFSVAFYPLPSLTSPPATRGMGK